MMDESVVATQRDQAIELFKKELMFILKLYNSDREQTSYLISLCSEPQINCLLYILFFIAKKEIPMRRSSLNLLTKENKKCMKKMNQNLDYFISVLEMPFDAKVSIIQSFKNSISSLVYPIINKC